MNDIDKKRLARALKEAWEHVAQEARCYCLQNEPEYLEFKTLFDTKIRELKE